MRLGYFPPVTPQIIRTHARALRRARCGWCVRALGEHAQIRFPRQSTLRIEDVEALEHRYGFEQLNKSYRSPSGVILAWARGRRLPSLKSRRELLQRTDGAVDLDRYLGHPLARLAALEPPPLDWLQAQIAGAPRGLRRLAGLPLIDGPVVVPAAVTRRQCQAVRDRGSIDALLLLLALTRHAEVTDDFDAHRGPAQAAWDLLPRVIASTPWLQGNWKALVECLHRVVWARLYDSGSLAGPPLCKLTANVQHMLDDAHADVALLAGPLEPPSRQAVRELMHARFEIEQLRGAAAQPDGIDVLCARIDELVDAVKAIAPASRAGTSVPG